MGGFKKSLRPCPLDESSLSIGRVNYAFLCVICHHGYVCNDKEYTQEWMICEMKISKKNLLHGNDAVMLLLCELFSSIILHIPIEKQISFSKMGFIFSCSYCTGRYNAVIVTSIFFKLWKVFK